MIEFKSTVKRTGDVYRYIFKHRTSSRQMIANDLGISLPTITQILNLLKENGLIYNAGEFESTGGRKANMFSVIPGARVSIGVDITKDSMAIVLTDMELKILDTVKTHVMYNDEEACYQMIADRIEEILDENKIDRKILLGVGISLPAIVDEENSEIIYAKLLNMPENFYRKLKDKIPYELRLFNDANSAGRAEKWNQKEERNMVYLSISDSVGGAIVDDTLYSGDNWRKAEFGHMTIVPKGRKCYCGSEGCLNAYCSAKKLSMFENGDLKQFFKKMKDGNKAYKNLFQDYMEYLAIAVNNLRMCFDCDVVLGGSVGACMDEYLEEFRVITKVRNPYEDNADYIKVCSFQTEASAAGAALFFIDQFIRTM